MNKVSILVFALFALLSCTKDDCLTTKIKEFKNDQRNCENASIIKYNFQGQEVYSFKQGICVADGGTEVILEDCSMVCFLGGFSGSQVCNGESFLDVAEEVEVLWEK